MGYHRKRERHMDRKRERRGMQCYMKKEDNSLIYVESAETTGERCRHLSWRTPLNSSLCTFIGMKHISPTFMHIIPMYLRLTTFTKTLPQMSFHLYFFAIFISLWGSTHDSADCCSAHRSSATRDSFKRVHDWCKAGWRRPGDPPKQKFWLRRCSHHNHSVALTSYGFYPAWPPECVYALPCTVKRRRKTRRRRSYQS